VKQEQQQTSEALGCETDVVSEEVNEEVNDTHDMHEPEIGEGASGDGGLAGGRGRGRGIGIVRGRGSVRGRESESVCMCVCVCV
jgi:hypothetical protein